MSYKGWITNQKHPFSLVGLGNNYNTTISLIRKGETSWMGWITQRNGYDMPSNIRWDEIKQQSSNEISLE